MGAVGSMHVVVDSPVLDEHLGFEEAVELPAVEQLVSQPAVERLDPGVLPGGTGVDEHGGDIVEATPVGHGGGDELGPVVEADEGRSTAPRTRRSRVATTVSASMERSTTMAGRSRVYSSTMLSSLRVRPSAVVSNWKSMAHRASGAMGHIAPTAVPMPRWGFLRLR